jgi:hypothetical protein
LAVAEGGRAENEAVELTLGEHGQRPAVQPAEQPAARGGRLLAGIAPNLRAQDVKRATVDRGLDPADPLPL